MSQFSFTSLWKSTISIPKNTINVNKNGGKGHRLIVPYQSTCYNSVRQQQAAWGGGMDTKQRSQSQHGVYESGNFHLKARNWITVKSWQSNCFHHDYHTHTRECVFPQFSSISRPHSFPHTRKQSQVRWGLGMVCKQHMCAAGLSTFDLSFSS